MVILALLVVALGLLVFGLVQFSSMLLVASLVVSLLAGLVLWRARMTKAAGRHEASTVAVDEPAARAEEPQVWVIDGRPRYHREGCEILDPDSEPVPRSQAVEDGFIACSLCQPDLDRTT
jgi:hypothetical protein